MPKMSIAQREIKLASSMFASLLFVLTVTKKNDKSNAKNIDIMAIIFTKLKFPTVLFWLGMDVF